MRTRLVVAFAALMDASALVAVPAPAGSRAPSPDRLVDPAQLSDATCDVVSNCASDKKRLIHFMNTNSEPRPGATAYLRCEKQPIAPLPSVCR